MNTKQASDSTETANAPEERRLVSSRHWIKPVGLSLGVLTLFVAIGIWGMYFLFALGERDAKDNLLSIVRTTAAGLPIEDIKQLQGTPADLDTRAYLRVQEALSHVNAANKTARFVYILGLKEGQIVFLADGEPRKSVDFSAPGDVYEGASMALRLSFSDCREFVEGPLSDRWGVWVSGHAPLRDPQTGAVIAVVGIDISAKDWRMTIATHQWIRISMVVFLMLLMGGSCAGFLYATRTKHILCKQVVKCEQSAAMLLKNVEEKDFAYNQLKISKCELEAIHQQLKAQQLELCAAYQQLKEQGHQIRRHEVQYRQLVEKANSIILQMDAEGFITFFNEYAQHFFGYSMEAIRGKNVIGTIIPKVDSSGQDLSAMILNIVAHPERYEINVNENMRCNGERVHVAWSNQAIRDEDGHIIGVLCIGNDITAQQHTEKEHHKELTWIQRQQAALVQITTSEGIVNGDIDLAASTMTEVTCSTLGVEQVGVWLLSEDGNEFRCLDQYQMSCNKHTRDMVLHADEYPHYFDVLRNARVIDAHDAQNDPRTAEFTKAYLLPRGITSMLDAVVRRSGELVGIVCVEHVGPVRTWSANESAFAAAIADQVVQALMSDDRRRREQALRESENQYRTLFESANDAILLMEGNRLVDCNLKSLEVFGCTREQILNQEVHLFSPKQQPDGRNSKEKAEEKINAALNGTPQSFEWRYGNCNGTLFDAEVSLNGLNLSGRNLILAIVRDVTERKQTEAERLLLTMAIEQAAETIIITDTKGIIEYVNPAFEHTTGYRRGEIIGMNPRMFKSEKHNAGFYQNMWNTLKRGDVWSGKIINKRKDGTLLQEEATISPVRNPEGKTTHYVAVERDVTREAELEVRLRQAQKMEAIGTLAGGIAHDFNNILQALMGYTDLLDECLPQNDMISKYLTQLKNAEKRAKDLVSQILAFSRQSEQERKSLEIQPIIKEALKLLRGALPSTIEIRQNISPHCGPVLADPTQIHQVVMNLSTNAYHAMRDPGGVLEVVLDTFVLDDNNKLSHEHSDLDPGTYAKIIVRDTGIGMDKATLERIFEPYFTTKEKGEGTGLGLATVHGIVKSHDGIIMAQSELGKGSTFTVLLPLAKCHDVPDNKKSHGQTSVRGRERILFVDDEVQIVQSGKAALEILGYQVTTYTNSIEALKKFRLSPNAYDLVITDQTMPKLTGIELAKEILMVRSDLPVILYTGHSEIVDEQSALAAGIRSFLMKPITFEDLAATVRCVLS